MARQYLPQAIDSPPSVAQNLAKSTDPDSDAAMLAALKRIIENRIAALEILQTLAADRQPQE